MRYEIAGTSEQRTAERWPPPGNRSRHWYPSADGSLDLEPDVVANEATWVHDPDDPVPSPVDNAFAFLAEYPDERSLAAACRRPRLRLRTTPLDPQPRRTG